MARKRMVTRTVKGTTYICLCLNTENCEPCNKEVTTGETFKSAEKRDNYLRTRIDTDTLKFVQVVDAVETETLYGMEESKFIANAEVLPARKNAIGETVPDCDEYETETTGTAEE